MKHVKALKSEAGRSVHALIDDKETWCGFRIYRDETLNGHPIPKVAETNDPLTCGRCRKVMSGLIHHRLQQLSSSQVEKLLEETTLMLLPEIGSHMGLTTPM